MYDNSSAVRIPDETLRAMPAVVWMLKDLEIGALGMFFLELIATTRPRVAAFEPSAYVRDWDWSNVGFAS